jgi:hypothetical protein
VTHEPAPSALAAEAICDEDEILAAVAAEASSANGWAEAGGFYQLSPLYFIGDSRVIPFRNAVYVSPYTTRAYALRSVHLRSLHAADFYSPEDGINAALTGALATDQAMISHDEGAHWYATVSDQHAGPGPAPLVLFCGPYDVHRVLDELGPDVDIIPWDERSERYALTMRPASRLVPADDVTARMLEMMQPFAVGIRALQAIGFTRIFVHGSYRSFALEQFDERYAKLKWLRQYHPNALLRMVALLDDVLRRIALDTASRYVTGPIDADGMLADEFTYDGLHYSALGAGELARRVVSVLEGVVE